MKRFTLILVCLSAAMLLGTSLSAQKYEYPFQNPNLPEEERVENLLSLMTLEEKIATFSGLGVPRLGVPDPGSSEAIHGLVRGGSTDLESFVRISQLENASRYASQQPKTGPMIYSTSFPQAYGLGETWDRDILKMVGEVTSIEARYHSWKTGRNCLVLWAPNADLARDPRWGRTEESFGEDPFLVAELTVQEVQGMQGNDPKYWRTATVMKHFLANSNEDGRSYTSSDFDEALFRDYYSYPFWKGVVEGGSRSLMTAYNKYNGIPCSTDNFIKEILIDEWGMDGQILNDGSALTLLVSAHKWAADKKEGVKVSVEAGITRILDRFADEMLEAVKEGSLSEAVVDENTKFNLRTICRLGLMDSSDANPYKDMGFTDVAPWETDEYKQKALLATQKSVVLLKNEGNILPLDTKKVKKIAVFGNRAESVMKDWYGAIPTYKITALQGIRNAVEGTDVEVRYQQWDSDGEAQKLAEWADVCIVCVGNNPMTSPDWENEKIQAPWGEGNILSDGREAVDRRSLELDSEDLIKVVWKANPNTVVALHMAQSSQELGTALADVIFGKYNPAGRTNQTWVKDILDLPNMLDYDIRNGRTYMYYKGETIYPFGHGLSYTTYEYSDLKVRRAGDEYKVTFNVKNTGAMDGEEVVQLYVKVNGDDAAMRLRGFDRIAVPKGQTVAVTLNVPEEDLRLWDMDKHSFEINKGDSQFMVGASSADIRLTETVKLK